MDISGLPPKVLAAYLRDPRLMMMQQITQRGTSGDPVHSPLEGMARMLSGMVGAWGQNRVGSKYEEQGTAYNQGMANLLRQPDIDSMIKASADNPALQDVGQELAMAKVKSDYEVNKLLGVERAKQQLDPTFAVKQQAMSEFLRGKPEGGVVQPYADQVDNPLPAPNPPNVQSQNLMPPAGDSGAMNIPKMPAGQLSPNAPPMNAQRGTVQPPSVTAMGRMADQMPPAAFDATQPPVGGGGQGYLPPVQGQPLSMPSQQDLQADTAKRLAGLKPTEGYMFTANGGQMPIPKHTDANGQPIAKMNNDQSNAAGFHSRMMNAEGSIENNYKAGLNPIDRYASQIPFVGNMLASKEYQQLDQAQRDFVNSQLRKESGAAISPSEFDSAAKQYFPQIGDSPEVIQQKELNRKTSMEAMRNAAGQGYHPEQQRQQMLMRDAQEAIAKGANPQAVQQELMKKLGGQ